MGNLSGESREQNRKDKVTRFRSVTYARQLGLLVNTLGSHLNGFLKKTNLKVTQFCEQNLGHARASREYPILRNSSATASEYNKFPKTSVT